VKFTIIVVFAVGPFYGFLAHSYFVFDFVKNTNGKVKTNKGTKHTFCFSGGQILLRRKVD
jgi:hypothetical protein